MEKTNKEMLTIIGKMIKKSDLKLNYIIENTGINRNRLGRLRTQKNTILTFKEGILLAETLNIPMTDFVEKFKTESLQELN